jgi:hypothetical protein
MVPCSFAQSDAWAKVRLGQAQRVVVQAEIREQEIDMQQSNPEAAQQAASAAAQKSEIKFRTPPVDYTMVVSCRHFCFLRSSLQSRLGITGLV